MEGGECSCFARLVFSCSNSRPRNRYAQLSLRVYARSLQRSEMEGQGRGRGGIAIEKATWKRKMVREKSIKRASNLSRSRNEAFSIRPFANFLNVPTVFVVSLFLANAIRTADKTPSVAIITSYVSIEFLEILFDLSKEQIFIGNPCDATTSLAAAHTSTVSPLDSLCTSSFFLFPSLPSYSSSSLFFLSKENNSFANLPYELSFSCSTVNCSLGSFMASRLPKFQLSPIVVGPELFKSIPESYFQSLPAKFPENFFYFFFFRSKFRSAIPLSDV